MDLFFMLLPLLRPARRPRCRGNTTAGALRRFVGGWLVLAMAPIASAVAAESPALDAPNVVAISPRLVTSGQPTAPALAGLGAQGFEAVVYLAPPTVHGAVPDEAVIVARQGLLYINLPIDFEHPQAADVQAFNALMRALGERKVLVHCQINLRASTMVFLYRTLVQGTEPAQAYADVSRVWTPEGPWRRLAEDALRRQGIDFRIE